MRLEKTPIRRSDRSCDNIAQEQWTEHAAALLAAKQVAQAPQAEPKHVDRCDVID